MLANVSRFLLGFFPFLGVSTRVFIGLTIAHFFSIYVRRNLANAVWFHRDRSSPILAWAARTRRLTGNHQPSDGSQ